MDIFCFLFQGRVRFASLKDSKTDSQERSRTRLIQMLVYVLHLRAWGQPIGFGICKILLDQPGRALGHCTVFLFSFQRAGKFATWDTHHIPKSSTCISAYSCTTLEFFQAKNPNSNLIKAITPFWQPPRFCPFLCWSRCLSDPTARRFRCAKLAEKYPDKKKKKQTTSCWVSKLKWLSTDSDKHQRMRGGSREGSLTAAPAATHTPEASVSPSLDLWAIF